MAGDWSCPDAELVLSVEDGKDRERWLAERRKGIGGSDIAALMGEGKYSTEFDVWLDKTGRTTDQAPTLQMEMGVRWEAAAADKFSEDYGLELRRRGMLRSKAHPLHLCNADRLAADGYGVEIKVVNGFMKMPADLLLRQGWPAQWWWQGIENLLVSGRQGWYLVVAIGNSDFQVRTMDRNDPQVQADMARAVETVGPWWQKHIVEGQVPAMGAPPELPDLPEKDRYEFFIPEEGFEIRDRLREIRETRAELEREAKEIKEKLAADTGGARWLYADGRPILEFNPRSGRKMFQKKRFFAEEPISGDRLRKWVDETGTATLEPYAADLLGVLDTFKLTEEQFTTKGDPGTALLIVGDKSDE